MRRLTRWIRRRRYPCTCGWHYSIRVSDGCPRHDPHGYRTYSDAEERHILEPWCEGWRVEPLLCMAPCCRPAMVVIERFKVDGVEVRIPPRDHVLAHSQADKAQLISAGLITQNEARS